MRTYPKTSSDTSKLFKALKFEKSNFAHFVSHSLDGNVHKDLFWQNWRFLKALRLQTLKKANFAHFVTRQLDENVLKDPFDKIGRPHGLKTLKLEKPKKANFVDFINSLLIEKVLKELLWLKCGLLKVLKLEKLKKANFARFVSARLIKKYSKSCFWTLKYKNRQKGKLFSFSKPPTWWKEVCRSKKAIFTHFVQYTPPSKDCRFQPC